MTKKLPAKISTEISVQVPTILALVLVAAAQSYFFLTVLSACLAGDFVTAFSFGVASLFFLWMTGACYISLPLSLYFHANYRAEMNFAKIDSVHRRALKLLKSLPFRRQESVVSVMSNLGLLRLCQGYYENSEDLFLEASNYLEKNKRMAQSVSMIVVTNNLAVARLRQNKLVEAELLAERAEEIADLPSIAKASSILKAPPLAVMASCRYRLGELESALDYCKQSIQIYENSPIPKQFAPSSFDQAKIFAYLGLALITVSMDRIEESLAAFDQFQTLAEANPSAINTMAIESLNLLANEYMNRKILDRAEMLLEFAYHLGRQYPFHPDAKQTLNYYEKLFLLTDRQSEVQDMRSWLRPTKPKLITRSNQ